MIGWPGFTAGLPEALALLNIFRSTCEQRYPENKPVSVVSLSAVNLLREEIHPLLQFSRLCIRETALG